MGTTSKDPVCGMDLAPEASVAKSEYKGQTYYFCCPACKKRFDQDPERYLHKVSVSRHQ